MFVALRILVADAAFIWAFVLAAISLCFWIALAFPLATRAVAIAMLIASAVLLIAGFALALP